MGTSATILRVLSLPALIILACTLFVSPAAATVVSTAHYQKEIQLQCTTGFSCAGGFPRVGANHQLNATRMTCQLRGDAGSEYAHGELQLHTGNGTHLLYEHLPVEHSASNGYHTFDRAIDVQAAAGQYIDVQLYLVTGSATLYGFCTLTGTLDTLG